jgi:hypothetical protein
VPRADNLTTFMSRPVQVWLYIFFTYMCDGFLFVICLYEAMWSEDTSGLSKVNFTVVSSLISAHPCH